MAHSTTTMACRLSPQQRRVWDLIAKDAGPYRATCVLRVRGPIDETRLQAAVTRVVDAYEILRMRFGALPSSTEPFQEPVPAVEAFGIRRRRVTIESDPHQTRDASVRELLDASASARLELDRGRVFDAVWAPLSADEGLLSLTLPALCCDVGGIHQLTEKIAAAYASAALDSLEPGPSLQYRHLAEWQNELLESADTQSGREYWTRDVTTAAVAATGLPFKPIVHTRTLDAASVAALMRGASDLRVSPRAFLLACFHTLLVRTIAKDVVPAVIQNPREQIDVEGGIGLLARSVPLKVESHAVMPWRDLVSRIQDGLSECAEWQQFCPLPERDRFFPFCFEYGVRPPELIAGPLRVSVVAEYDCLDRFDVKLVGIEQGERLGVALHYDLSRHTGAEMEWWTGRLEQVIRMAVAEPGRAIGTLPIVSDAERALIANEWNGTEAPVSGGPWLHEGVTARAAADPEAPAIVTANGALSYGALETRANQVAHALRAVGVGTETRVGLCVDWSAELVIGILGILKAGAVSVPLDPAQPVERLRQIVADHGVSLILTVGRCSHVIPGEAASWAMDDARPWADQPAIAPTVTIEGEQLAHIIHTPGAVTPSKAVGVTHAQARQAMHTRTAVYGAAAARCLLLGSAAVDSPVAALCWTLSVGGTLYLPVEGHQADQTALSAQIAAGQITHVIGSPSMYDALLRGPGARARLVSLREVMLIGEPYDADLLTTHEAIAAGARLSYEFGPPEATGIDTVHLHTGGTPVNAVSIGRPVAHSRVYVLDAHGALAPVGVAGELYVGGAGIARGYLGQPALTATRVRPDPFAKTPGARMHGTGVRGLWRADGQLELARPRSAEVMLRGRRIDPAVIEAVLRERPEVADAAVMVRGVGGQEQLVAYWIPRGVSPSAAGLRAWLRERLPAHQVPSMLMAVATLPARPGNDRPAMPAPPLLAEPEGEAPRTQLEEIVAMVWAGVLRREHVGRHTDFFEAGGHSLLATQVVSRLRTALNVRVTLPMLFEAPTIAGIASTLARLQRDAQGLSMPPLEQAPRDRPLPVSFAQQRLWFLQQLQPDNPFYNVTAALRLEGPLQPEALAQAVRQLLARHEVLRTAFPSVDGKPVQVITPPAPLALPVEDLSALSPAARDAAVRQTLATETHTPFDLTQGPVVRVRLLRLGAAEHVCVFSLHHIVTDGWSMSVLVEEVSALYAAAVRGETAPLAALPLQYADYAAWQRAWLQGDVLARQLAYWRSRLSNAPALELPTDRPRRTGAGLGATHTFEIPAAIAESLRALARQKQATLFTVVLAAWQALLSRWTGETDIVVGTPVGTRGHAELEGLIGCFLNMLVLRTDLGDEPSFAALVTRVRSEVLDAFVHQDVPFEAVVAAMQPERAREETPLFRVMFTWHNEPRSTLVLAGVTWTPMPLPERPSQFDLTLELVDTEGPLQASLVYRTDLFDAATVARLATHLLTIVTAVAADPDRPMNAVPLMTDAERTQVVKAWNATAVTYPAISVPARISAQAVATPAACAVVAGGTRLTYAVLEARANQVAHALRAAGLGAESRVGLCVDRSAALVIGVLGILKAGAAYVPLDPAAPPARLADIIADSGVSVVLSVAATATAVPAPALVWDLDDDEHWEAQPATAPAVEIDDAQLAYVLYTSGSTGRPKGVMVPHAGLANYVTWACAAYDVAAGQGTLLHSPLGFDLTVTSLFPPLVTGRTVTLVTDALDGLAAAFTQTTALSLVKITPAHLATLATQVPTTAAAGRTRAFVIGGEALTAEHVAFWRAHAPATRLLNEYGPTETVVGCCLYEVTAEDAPTGPLPIGRPIANTQVYVVDAHGDPAPIGISGELYIGGAGVTRGYAGKPAATAAAFLPDPYAATPGARRYRTGDRARWQADGELAFVGRRDAQVKVRGYRIELAEVEYLLRELPAVQAAAAAAPVGPTGERTLVGYIVWRSRPADGVEAVRRALAMRAPGYLIPPVLIELPELPMTTRGKIDHALLPRPVAQARGSAPDTRPPFTPLEEIVAGVWREVLQHEAIERHTNFFFDAGGHSLLATQVVARLEAALQIEMPVALLFDAPALGELAAAIETRLRDRHGVAPPAIVPVSRHEPLPVSFAQQRLWFLDQLQPGSGLYVGNDAIHLAGPLHVDALEQALQQLVERHEVLRTTFSMVNGSPVQVIASHQPIAVLVEDLSGVSEDRDAAMSEAIKRAMRESFDLREGPLLRMRLLRLNPEEHVCVFCLHHIATDGWSMSILMGDLRELYAAALRDETAMLPPLPLQYADYAAWQRAWLQGDVLERQLAYWRRELAGAPVLDLPTDRPRLAGSAAGALYSFVIPSPVVADLRAVARQQQATLFMVVLAAWQALLARWTGQADILVGTPVGTRGPVALERLIGCFLNMLVLRTEVRDTLSFAALVARVRTKVLAAYAHQDAPFEAVVAAVQPERATEETPLFRVLFTWHNEPSPTLALDGVSGTRMPRAAQTSKFDLTLAVTEVDGELQAALEYRTDLFDRATMARLAAQLETFIAQAASDPDRCLDDVSLVHADEQRQLLEWSQVRQ